MVGVPMPEPESFSCSDPKVPDAQTRNSEAIKHIQRNTARNSHLIALMRSLIAHAPSPAAETASAASSRAASVNP